jgi:hypothetical protein
MTTPKRRLSNLDVWRADPIEFIETVLYDPETGKPFVLLPAERDFLRHAFQLDADGRLLYPEQGYAAPKKSGKTGFAALHGLTTVLLFGGYFGECYCLANDFEQASSRVFQAIRRGSLATALSHVSSSSYICTSATGDSCCLAMGLPHYFEIEQSRPGQRVGKLGDERRIAALDHHHAGVMNRSDHADRHVGEQGADDRAVP